MKVDYGKRELCFFHRFSSANTYWQLEQVQQIAMSAHIADTVHHVLARDHSVSIWRLNPNTLEPLK